MESTATTSANNGHAAGHPAGNHDKFLTFCLGQEVYGLPILVVREIIGMIDITPLPRTPSYMKGVINLRGKIIPVIELRSRFGLPSVPYTEETCIVVVESGGDATDGGSQMGVVVDAVREVLDISRTNIEQPPTVGNAVPASSIMGIGKVKDKVVILLDIDSVGGAAAGESLRLADQTPASLTTPPAAAAA